MSGCEQFALGTRPREICDGHSELTLKQANKFRALYGIEPLEGEDPPGPLMASSGIMVTRGAVKHSARAGGCCDGGVATTPAVMPVPVARVAVEHTGVGGRLIEIFTEVGFEKCDDCYALARRMNEWGPNGCTANMDAIVGNILPRALIWQTENLGWFAKLVPEAATEASIQLLVENAIATARPLEWIASQVTQPTPAVPVARKTKTGPATKYVTRPDTNVPGSSLKTDRVMGGVVSKVQDDRPDGWWNDAVVQQQHRDQATKFINTIPVYPGHFDGRGIVITGGGKYFVSAYITIRVIRHVGCTLPIELWYLDGEMDDEMTEMVSEHSVTCHNASELARGTGYFLSHWWRGWQLKAFALLHSSFREVLMLDADSYPVRNPSVVFEWPEYQRTGAIIWPDVGASARLFPRLAAETLGVPQFNEGAAESGQLVANKEHCWRALNLAKHYNRDADYVYHIVYGDKDTFPVAFHRLGMKYSRMSPNCKMNGPGIQQLDQHGNVLFNHRIHDKFRIHNTRFDSTAQRGDTHQRAAGWLHEEFCHAVIKELEQRWK